jgi:serine/threonine protein kinase
MADRIGQQLGNYCLRRLLGQGGFADVYLGEHVYLGTNAAVKVLQARLSSEGDLKWFLNEARTVARLSHPNIVRVLDFGVDNETPFLVIEYAPNGTLRERHPQGTMLPITTIVSYVKQVAAALQYAHDEKLIHRDVKPENMLVGRRDEILLNDFGVALIAQSTRDQSTESLAGTAMYIAPEQIQGKPRTASDQYSLGIVVYEWLTGYVPFSGSFTELCTQHLFAPPPPLKEKVPTIDPAVEQVVTRALAKDPKQRFESISAFADALEQAAGVRPVPLTIEGPRPSDPSPSTALASPVSRRMQISEAPDGYTPLINTEGLGESIGARNKPVESSRDAGVFVHKATPATIGKNYTVIDNPLTNGNPNAILIVTQNWNPGGGNGRYNNHPVGVWYTPSGNWSIFNEDLAPMPPQASFNVQVLNPSSLAFVHQATSSNVDDNYTFFNASATDGDPDAIVLVTQNWSPQGKGGIYNNHEVSVWYTRSGNWAIFNVDRAPMTLQASFNIEIV